METLKSNGNGVTETLLENRAEDQHHQSNVDSWWRRLFILYFVENVVGIRLLQNTEVLYLYEYFIDFLYAHMKYIEQEWNSTWKYFSDYIMRTEW